MILVSNITGTSIDLKTLSCKDASKAYLDWLNDSSINAFLEVRRNPPKSIEDLNIFINNCIESENDLLIGIFTKENKHIGNIKILFNWENLRCEVGIIVGDRNFWGKGIATEGIRLVTNYLIKETNIKKLLQVYTSKILAHKKLLKRQDLSLKASLKITGTIMESLLINHFIVLIEVVNVEFSKVKC